eukprot:TRINITY_DN9249_c0_g2_i1.p1 TRINITY_DN9249_c0_g2~~TRINITY_DN9249_c0_g2_i1.p1  ORF type:complete len:454 (+),score=100.59 TRINITY_DN9249_c0_g2_i1:122-1483(+)
MKLFGCSNSCGSPTAVDDKTTPIAETSWDLGGYAMMNVQRFFCSEKRVWLELYGRQLLVFARKDQKPTQVLELEGVMVEELSKGFQIPVRKLKFTLRDRETTKQWLEMLQLNGIHVEMLPTRGKHPSVLSSNTSFDWVMINSWKDVPPKMADFEILETIGHGGFGTVVKACHKATSVHYAMKIVRKTETAPTEQAVLESIQHPFIVQLHAVFETQTKLCLVMDLLPGGELFQHLREGGFSEYRAGFYAAEICLALSFIHNQKFIYRDLKPENCLIDAEGHVVLADFGLAKKIDENVDTATTLCGTPSYIAPEVLQGEVATTAVDWWSWGCMLYRMMTGSELFYDPSHASRVYDSILNTDPDFPLSLSPNARDLLTNTLRKSPSERYSSHEIKTHPFYEALDWGALYRKEIPPPAFTQAKTLTQSSEDHDDTLFDDFSGRWGQSLGVGSPTSAL